MTELFSHEELISFALSGNDEVCIPIFQFSEFVGVCEKHGLVVWIVEGVYFDAKMDRGTQAPPGGDFHLYFWYADLLPGGFEKCQRVYHSQLKKALEPFMSSENVEKRRMIGFERTGVRYDPQWINMIVAGEIEYMKQMASDESTGRKVSEAEPDGPNSVTAR